MARRAAAPSAGLGEAPKSKIIMIKKMHFIRISKYRTEHLEHKGLKAHKGA